MPPPSAPEPWRPAQVLRAWGRALLDVVYPQACRACDEPLPSDHVERGLHEWLCVKCRGELPRIEPPFCMACGEAYDGAISGEFRCMNCADRKFAFEYAVAGYRAEGEARELIHRFSTTAISRCAACSARCFGERSKIHGWLPSRSGTGRWCPFRCIGRRRVTVASIKALSSALNSRGRQKSRLSIV